MINPKTLSAAFAKAGLKLEISKEPLRQGRGMNDIFQIDVQRKLTGAQRGEWYRMYVGNEATEVSVRDTDKEHSQVVLMVREPAGEFEEKVDFTLPMNRMAPKRVFDEWVRREVLTHGRTLVRKVYPGAKERGHVIVRQTTDGAMRYFLMGVDERQLFIAQLTNAATTVDGARKLLGRTVQFAEGKRKGSSLDRQGEWFFLETSQGQRDHIDQLIQQNKISVHKKAVIGTFASRGGKPHTADELVSLPLNKISEKARLAHGFPVRSRQIYIRGAVRHSDHKTVKFSQWREVIANNEGATGQAGATGVLWVD